MRKLYCVASKFKLPGMYLVCEGQNSVFRIEATFLYITQHLSLPGTPSFKGG
jgi:hypothetical protein